MTEEDLRSQEALLTLIRTGWGQDNPAFRQMFSSLFIPGASQELMDSFNEMMRVATAPDVAARIMDVLGNAIDELFLRDSVDGTFRELPIRL